MVAFIQAQFPRSPVFRELRRQVRSTGRQDCFRVADYPEVCGVGTRQSESQVSEAKPWAPGPQWGLDQRHVDWHTLSDIVRRQSRNE